MWAWAFLTFMAWFLYISEGYLFHMLCIHNTNNINFSKSTKYEYE